MMLKRMLHLLVYKRLSKETKSRLANTFWRLYKFLSVPSEGKFRIKIKGHIVILKDPGNSTILSSMYTHGYSNSDWEQPQRRLVEYLSSYNDTVFFDIGSNIGIFAYIAESVNPSAKIYAFEPLPANVSYIKDIVRLNRFRNISVEPYALSDSTGTSTLFVPQTTYKYPDLASFVNRFEGSDRLHRNLQSWKLEVNVTTLDDFVSDKHINKIDLIKLDVEEAEIEVIKGGEKTISRFHPDIICEILIDSPRKYEVFACLTILGYRGYLITPKGLVREEEPLILPNRCYEGVTLFADHYFTFREEGEVEKMSVSCLGNYNDMEFLSKISTTGYML